MPLHSVENVSAPAVASPHEIPVEIQDVDDLKVKLSVGGDLVVVRTETGRAVLLDVDGAWEVVLERATGWEGARILPTKAGAVSQTSGNKLKLKVPESRPVMIETPGQPSVFLIAGPRAGTPPVPRNRGRLLRFEGGRVHQAGTISLGSGDVLWLDAGAWVRGHVIASKAENVVIGGRGVLDASWKHPSGLPTRPVVLDHCRDVEISGITMLRPQHWMLTVGGCENVLIEDTRQIGDGLSTDGIDVVGSRRVTIRNCFLRNGDDNIAIKALDVKRLASPCQLSAGDFDGDWTGPVEEILIEGCALYNDHGGTAMEIGYETRTSRIRNVTFRDIDVMAVHQFGSVFGIHNGDRALVENVLWEDIRVEHHYDKLVDFRILNSRWNRDPDRGHVRNITLREIRATRSIYNEGYTVSLIGGFDDEHRVSGVSFEDFELGGKHAQCGDDLDLFTRHATDITFS